MIVWVILCFARDLAYTYIYMSCSILCFIMFQVKYIFQKFPSIYYATKNFIRKLVIYIKSKLEFLIPQNGAVCMVLSLGYSEEPSALYASNGSILRWSQCLLNRFSLLRRAYIRLAYGISTCKSQDICMQLFIQRR